MEELSTETKKPRKKGIKLSKLLQKERLIVNVNEELVEYIKNKIEIPEEEHVKIVLDDSLFKNLENIVVFTDKNIYWTIKNASMKIINPDTEISVNGAGIADNEMLDGVSVFSTVNNNIISIYVLNSKIQLIIPFENFDTANSLTFAFYDYISNHCGGYKPNDLENESLFKEISGENSAKTNIIAGIFSWIGNILILWLAINVFQKPDNILISNENIIYGALVLKMLSFLFGNRKSIYTNFLVFASFVFIKDNPDYYLIYAGILLLINVIFDFDVLFKYLFFIITGLSLVHIIIKGFPDFIEIFVNK